MEGSMNLIEHYVTKIFGEPYEAYGMWWLRVEADCYGRIGENIIMFNTKNEAMNVSIGYEFFA
jgi:hypothetical protein